MEPGIARKKLICSSYLHVIIECLLCINITVGAEDEMMRKKRFCSYKTESLIEGTHYLNKHKINITKFDKQYSMV